MREDDILNKGDNDSYSDDQNNSPESERGWRLIHISHFPSILMYYNGFFLSKLNFLFKSSFYLIFIKPCLLAPGLENIMIFLMKN